ncbi:hypothetical protein HK28_07890 [Acetobacter sp. DsW_063]|nr:hypothetical protein HK28_07890 [Acetobacter sp. DsW_063]
MVMTSGGGFWPRAQVNPSMLLANDTAEEMVADALALQELIIEQKRGMKQKADRYAETVLALYRAKASSRSRGGFTVENMAGTMKVELTVADYQRVNGSILAAQALMNEVLDDLTEGLEPDIRLLLANAFIRDERTGQINVDRLAQVRKLRLSHPRWDDVRAAIADSIEKAGSREYLRFYRREKNTDGWEPITLQFSSL